MKKSPGRFIVRSLFLLTILRLPAVNGQIEEEFNQNTIDPLVWTVTQQDYSQNSGTVSLDGSGSLLLSVTSGWPLSPRSQTFLRSIPTLNETWVYHSRIRFNSGSVNRPDAQLGFYFEMSDGSQAYLLFDNRSGMQVSYGNPSESHDGPILYQNTWYELRFIFDGVEIRASYRESGRGEWLGNFSLITSWTATPLRVRIGQSGNLNPTSSTNVTINMEVDYFRSADSPPAAENTIQELFSYSTLNPAVWRKTENNFSQNTGSIGPDGQGLLVLSLQAGWPLTPLSQTYIESIPRLPNSPWESYCRILFNSSSVNRADINAGINFELSDGGRAFVLFDNRNGMKFQYGNTDEAHDGPALRPNIWYEWKFVYDGLELRAWFREEGKGAWLGNLGLHTSFSAYPERIRFGQCTMGNPASSTNVSIELLFDYWKFAADEPAEYGCPDDQFNLANINPNIWLINSVNFSQNTGTVSVNDQGSLEVGLQCGWSLHPIAQTFVRSWKRLPANSWTYQVRCKYEASRPNRTDAPLGFFFSTMEGEDLFFGFNSQNGMQIAYGAGGERNAGDSLIPNFWYDLKFEYDGTDLYGWYREDGSPTWLGQYKITQTGDEHPDFLYIGQTNIANPVSTTNFDQLLTVDFIDGDCSTTPLRIVAFEWMTPGKILIEWTSEPGSDYQVQALPPEEDANWQSISPVIPATTALTSWTIDAIPAEKTLMLRVLLLD